MASSDRGAPLRTEDCVLDPQWNTEQITSALHSYAPSGSISPQSATLVSELLKFLVQVDGALYEYKKTHVVES